MRNDRYLFERARAVMVAFVGRGLRAIVGDSGSMLDTSVDVVVVVVDVVDDGVAGAVDVEVIDDVVEVDVVVVVSATDIAILTELCERT